MTETVPEKRILCTGLVCLDILNYVKTYPSEDSDNRALEQIWATGGNAANNCTVLRELGTPCEFLGALADDHPSKLIEEHFHKKNILFKNIARRSHSNLPVTCATISLENGSRTIVHAPRSLVEITNEEFQKSIPTLSPYTLVHFEGRNLIETRKMLDYILALRNKEHSSILISVEIEKRSTGIESLIPGADIVFLSKTFAQSRTYSNMQTTVEGISSKNPNAVIICAWGELGACAKVQNEIVFSEAFPPGKVVDTLGAGDTFVAGVLDSLKEGGLSALRVERAIRFGCKLAGAKCGMRGFEGLSNVQL